MTSRHKEPTDAAAAVSAPHPPPSPPPPPHAGTGPDHCADIAEVAGTCLVQKQLAGTCQGRWFVIQFVIQAQALLQ